MSSGPSLAQTAEDDHSHVLVDWAPCQQCTEPGSRVLHPPCMLETLGGLTLIICKRLDFSAVLFSFSDFGKSLKNSFEYMTLKYSSDNRVSSCLCPRASPQLHRRRPAGYMAISPRLSVLAWTVPLGLLSAQTFKFLFACDVTIYHFMVSGLFRFCRGGKSELRVTLGMFRHSASLLRPSRGSMGRRGGSLVTHCKDQDTMHKARALHQLLSQRRNTLDMTGKEQK